MGDNIPITVSGFKMVNLQTGEEIDMPTGTTLHNDDIPSSENPILYNYGGKEVTVSFEIKGIEHYKRLIQIYNDTKSKRIRKKQLTRIKRDYTFIAFALGIF